MKTLKNSLLALALSLSFGAVACDGTDGDPAVGQPGQEDIGTSNSATEAADLTPFIGVWTYVSGSSTSTCGSAAGTTESSGAHGIVEIAAGTAPNTISVTDSGCVLSATVSGDEAVAAAGGACAGNAGHASIIYTVSGGTLHKGTVETIATAKFGVICSKKADATLVRQ
jgi:hypothetical protein